MCRSRSDVKTLQVSQGRRALPGEMQSLCGGHAQTTLVAFRAPSKTGLRLSIGRGRVSQRSGTGAIYLAVAHPSDSRGARSQRNPRQASPVQPIAEARVDVTNVSSRRFAARTLFRIQGKPSSIGGQRDRRTRAVRSFARQGKTARRFISHLLCEIFTPASQDTFLPMHDKLLALRLFVRVAHTGSFSAAARELDLSQPSVSRVIARSRGVRSCLLLPWGAKVPKRHAVALWQSSRFESRYRVSSRFKQMRRISAGEQKARPDLGNA